MKSKKNLPLILLATIWVVALTACGMISNAEAIEEPLVMEIDNTIVSATGILLPEHLAYLSMPAAGRVDEVFIAEGQSVSEGQNLLSLGELAQAEAGLASAEFEYKAAQQALDDLYENADISRANASIELLDAKSKYLTAEDEWESLDKDALEEDIDDAREDMLEAEQELEDAQDTFDRYADLDENNTLRTRYEDELKDAQEAYNEKVRARDELIIELETTEALWQSALAEVEKAQSNYDAVTDGPDPDQVSLADARLETAAARMDAVLEQIENLTLSAPFAGVVADIMITEGEWTSPGQPVVVLADLNSLRVETTDLNEIDVVQIEVGDMAEVTFDAIPNEVFEGTIIEISPKAAEGSGVNYTVVIDLAKIPDATRWGMTVFVDIDTKQ